MGSLTCGMLNGYFQWLSHRWYRYRRTSVVFALETTKHESRSSDRCSLRSLLNTTICNYISSQRCRLDRSCADRDLTLVCRNATRAVRDGGRQLFTVAAWLQSRSMHFICNNTVLILLFPIARKARFIDVRRISKPADRLTVSLRERTSADSRGININLLMCF